VRQWAHALFFCHVLSQLSLVFRGRMMAPRWRFHANRRLVGRHHFLMFDVSLECNARPFFFAAQQMSKLSVFVQYFSPKRFAGVVFFFGASLYMIWTWPLYSASLAIHVFQRTARQTGPMTFIIMRIRQQNLAQNNIQQNHRSICCICLSKRSMSRYRA